MTVLGVDLSHYNTMPVLDNYGFVFQKCTEGATIVDPTYASRHSAIRNTGKVFGAYHFLDMNVDSAQQVLFFLHNANLMPGDIAALDFEDDGTWSTFTTTEILAKGQQVLAGIMAWTGRVVVYMNRSTYAFASSLVGACDGLWIASPGATPTMPYLFWQYGISGVDQDQESQFPTQQSLMDWSNKVTSPWSEPAGLQAQGRLQALLENTDVTFAQAPVKEVNELRIALANLQSSVNVLTAKVDALTSFKGTFTITGSGTVG